MGLFLIILSAIITISNPKMSFYEFGSEYNQFLWNISIFFLFKTHKNITEFLKTNQVNSTSHYLN